MMHHRSGHGYVLKIIAQSVDIVLRIAYCAGIVPTRNTQYH